MSEDTSFAFVANLLDVNCNLPFEVTEDCYFQKANSKQIEIIRKYLLARSEYFRHNIIPYECFYIEENEQNCKTVKYQPLPPNDWKYYILSFPEGEFKILNSLVLSANLAEIELDLGLYFFLSKENKSYGYAHRTTDIFNFYLEMQDSLPPLIKSIQNKHLQEISLIYHRIQQLDATNSPNIKQAIKMLDELKHLSHYSKFNVLGLFTIIEFLITHKPVDTGDSITRQVTTKIPLLSHRFSTKLDYSQFFGKTDESTIWKKLYAYRSSIAHGGQANFAKELSVLKDDSTARKFLKLVVKMLLRHSLAEPQLYADLKEC